jgi:hypothetical protein
MEIYLAGLAVLVLAVMAAIFILNYFFEDTENE